MIDDLVASNEVYWRSRLNPPLNLSIYPTAMVHGLTSYLTRSPSVHCSKNANY
jgi:hypothetical protein